MYEDPNAFFFSGRLKASALEDIRHQNSSHWILSRVTFYGQKARQTCLSFSNSGVFSCCDFWVVILLSSYFLIAFPNCVIMIKTVQAILSIELFTIGSNQHYRAESYLQRSPIHFVDYYLISSVVAVPAVKLLVPKCAFQRSMKFRHCRRHKF